MQFKMIFHFILFCFNTLNIREIFLIYYLMDIVICIEAGNLFLTVRLFTKSHFRKYW